MIDEEEPVYLDLDGKSHLVGRQWGRVRKDRGNASFEYDESWLHPAARFSLAPALKLGPGPFHTPPTCRCSGLLAIRLLIGGDGC